MISPFPATRQAAASLQAIEQELREPYELTEADMEARAGPPANITSIRKIAALPCLSQRAALNPRNRFRRPFQACPLGRIWRVAPANPAASYTCRISP